jgi:uncharacterized membrane protein (DUF2068 family)
MHETFESSARAFFKFNQKFGPFFLLLLKESPGHFFFVTFNVVVVVVVVGARALVTSRTKRKRP